MSDKKTVRDEAPPPHDEGQFAAICVDVIDLGLNVEKFGEQPAELKDKTVLVFRTEAGENGHPREIAQEFTTSMGKKSNMRKFLESWRGKPYTDEEARKNGIPLDKLDGVGALLTIAHKTSQKGNAYAVIQAIVPLHKKMQDAMPSAAGYKRADFWAKKKDEYAKAAAAFQPKATGANSGGAAQFADYPEAVENEGDDDLPF